ncbi:MAG: sigma-70 family RNA polymerase sigma factor [bacterium]|nr:sigma-70 family RNA polymerase sigma factor [bacterium]MDZ4286285.1 sigma-70 family RNA polymerase sigma factor [Candidatus Sungbacteria bacterium]
MRAYDFSDRETVDEDDIAAGLETPEDIITFYFREMRKYDVKKRAQEIAWFTELDALYRKHIACIRVSKLARDLVRQATRPQSSLESDSDDDEFKEDTGYEWLRFWWRERNWRLIDRGFNMLETAAKDEARNESESLELRSILILVCPFSARATELRQEIVSHNLRLVITVAGRYETDKMSDVIQEGNIGLIHAVDKYLLKKGWKFGTYAVWWIRSLIARSIGAQRGNIRLPAHMVDRMRNLKIFVSDFHDTNGHYPAVEEIASGIKCSAESVRNLIYVWGGEVSLSRPVSMTDKRSLEEVLEVKSDFCFDQITDDQSRTRLIEYIYEGLKPRDKAILDLRFGLTSREPCTLDEVGDHLAELGFPRITKERVRQLERKIFDRVRGNPRARRLFHELTVA